MRLRPEGAWQAERAWASQTAERRSPENDQNAGATGVLEESLHCPVAARERLAADQARGAAPPVAEAGEEYQAHRLGAV